MKGRYLSMKKLNKIFALTLALALVFSLTVSASAEGYRTLDEIKAIQPEEILLYAKQP